MVPNAAAWSTHAVTAAARHHAAARAMLKIAIQKSNDEVMSTATPLCKATPNTNGQLRQHFGGLDKEWVVERQRSARTAAWMGCGGSKGVESLPVAPMEGSKKKPKTPPVAVAQSPPAKSEPSASPLAPVSPPPAHARPHAKGHGAAGTGDVDKEAKLRKLQEQEDVSIEQQVRVYRSARWGLR